MVRQNRARMAPARDFEIVALLARRFRRRSSPTRDGAVHCPRLPDEDVLEIFVIENLQRDDLSPLEQARGFKQLLQTNADRFSVSTIASKVGMSPAWVWDRIKLFDLVPEAQDLLEQGASRPATRIVLARPSLTRSGRSTCATTRSSPRRSEGWTSTAIAIWRSLRVRTTTPSLYRSASSKRGSRATSGSMLSTPPRLSRWRSSRWPNRSSRRSRHRAAEEGDSYHLRSTSPPGRERRERAHLRCPVLARADGREDAPTCEHSVLGVVVAGPKQGSAFEVCIARDRCDTHFGAEMKAALRAKGDSTGAKKLGDAPGAALGNVRGAGSGASAAEWEDLKPHVYAAAFEQVKKAKILTPGQAKQPSRA